MTVLSPGMPHMSATMSSRDHPYNRSTRPLLADRKPQLLLKKKLSNDTKVHGFNDFQDIVSQEYGSKNTHIGYPYGSPPSPSSVFNSSDFVFSDDRGYTTSTPNRIYDSCSPPMIATMQTPSSNGYKKKSNYFSNTDHHRLNSKTKTSKYCDLNWRTNSEQEQEQQGTTSHPRIPVSPPVDYIESDYSSSNSGPFIFGVHTADTFVDNHRTVINTKATTIYSGNGAKPVLNQTNSDTSCSSQGTEKDRRLFLKDHKESTKIIRKDKKLHKDKPPTIKCVLVGDGAVGKTNLIVSYLENRFLDEHIPTASDIYNAEVMVNDNPVHITLCDTAGQDTLDHLRELCYPDSDVFLLCFSIVKPETFHSIKVKWAPKFSKTKASLVLVGTQSDLRSDKPTLNKLQMKGEKPISFSDAWDLATSIGAKYIETSSFTQGGCYGFLIYSGGLILADAMGMKSSVRPYAEKVKDVFDTAIWEALAPSHLPPKPPLWKRLLCLA